MKWREVNQDQDNICSDRFESTGNKYSNFSMNDSKFFDDCLRMWGIAMDMYSQQKYLA